MTKTIDFNDLSTGTVVDNEYSSQGVTISGWTSQGAADRAMIFDTAHPTGDDNDLATNNLGNVLIVSEDGDSSDPDDNAQGGLLRFDFADGADVKSLTFLDVEEGASVNFYDEDGDLIAKSNVLTNEAGQGVADFNVDGVYRMEVCFKGSGAVDNLVYDDIAALDGTVEGTNGDDVIDLAYTGDPEGDRVDAEDAILPGDAPNDDLIIGYAGDDSIQGGLGDDVIYGDQATTGTVTTDARNIVEIAAGSDDFNMLVKALDTAGLVDTIQSSSDITVFAPTDAAFTSLAKQLGFDGDCADEDAVFDHIVGQLTVLGEGDPIPLLTDILTYHVSPGEQTTVDGTVTTLQGATFTANGTELVDNDPEAINPTIVGTVQAENGVIQVIDNVLLPIDTPITETSSTPTDTQQVDLANGVITIKENDPTLSADYDTTFSKTTETSVYTEDVWFAQAPTVSGGTIIGQKDLVEGNKYLYKVQLDAPVTEDTWVTVTIADGTANKSGADVREYSAPQTQGGTYEYGFDAYEEVQYYTSSEKLQQHTEAYWNNDPIYKGQTTAEEANYVGVEELVNDFKVFGGDGHLVTGDTLKVLVRAGEDTSQEFQVVTSKEIHLGERVMNEDRSNEYWDPFETEQTETFKLTISQIGDKTADDETTISIADVQANISPIAFDLNGNGEIDTTGDSTVKGHAYTGGDTVEIDLDADGHKDTVEWMDGSGDGLLINLDEINGTPVDNGEPQYITETRTLEIKGLEGNYDTSGYRQDFPGIFSDSDGTCWVDLTVPLDGDEGETDLYLSPFFGWSGTVVLFASNPDSDFVRDFSFSTSGYNTSNVYIDESVSVTTPSWNGSSNQATVSLGNGATSTLKLGGMVSTSIYNTPDTWQAPDFYTPGTEDRVETYEVKVENPDFGGVIVDGKALYGDEGGKYANGFEKLSQLEDTNNDGVVDGAELDNLAIWVDDGDGVLEAGELETLEENGIDYISTEMATVDGKMVGDAGSRETETGDAESSEKVIYSLEGVDAEFFQINAVTGEITYADGFVPDFEDPKDANGDNTYDLVVVRTGADLDQPTREDLRVEIQDDCEVTTPLADGNDTIDGGAGDDVIYGEGGDDLIEGGSGDDTIEGNAGDDVIYGDQGTDPDGEGACGIDNSGEVTDGVEGGVIRIVENDGSLAADYDTDFAKSSESSVYTEDVWFAAAKGDVDSHIFTDAFGSTFTNTVTFTTNAAKYAELLDIDRVVSLDYGGLEEALGLQKGYLTNDGQSFKQQLDSGVLYKSPGWAGYGREIEGINVDYTWTELREYYEDVIDAQDYELTYVDSHGVVSSLDLETEATSRAQQVSPIGFDLNETGAIETTGSSTVNGHSWNGGEVENIDLDNDGVAETIEWMDGSGDGLLIDLDKVDGLTAEYLPENLDNLTAKTVTKIIDGVEAVYQPPAGFDEESPGVYFDNVASRADRSSDDGVTTATGPQTYWIDLTAPGVSEIYLSAAYNTVVNFFASNPDATETANVSVSNSLAGYPIQNTLVANSDVSVYSAGYNGASNWVATLDSGATANISIGGFALSGGQIQEVTGDVPQFYYPGTADETVTETVYSGDNGELKSLTVNGGALFGDEGGKYANGFEKLAQSEDTNNDGVVDGAELDNLAVWVDDGDARLEAGELISLEEAGIDFVSTGMTLVDGKMVGEAGQTETTLGDAESTEQVTYSLDGVDAQFFQINAVTGEVSYADGFVPDFEDPKDANGDNTYELVIVRTGEHLVQPEREPLRVEILDECEKTSAADGNDLIDGGTGVDLIYGEGGDDTITGGAGSDEIYGGDDADVIFGDESDTVDGGAGGNDYDILDITGQGAYILTGPDGTGEPTPDSNGNGLDGRVVFVDQDGNPDGRVINFTEIEEIKGDDPVNNAPVAADNAYTVAADEAAGDVDGNVITDDTGAGVDSDPDGDAVTVVAVNDDAAGVGSGVVGSNGGLFIINSDGTVDFDANGDFDTLGLGETAETSVTYTITDDEGATDTASITFTVTGKNDGTVTGTEGNDVITPDVPFVDADGDIVDANDGILPGDEGTNNDLIDALGGDDLIDGGLGDDEIYGGTGLDTIEGGEGDDQIFGGNDDDRITDVSGSEEVFGGTGNDFIDVSRPLAEALPDVGYPFQTPDPSSGNPFPFPGYDADSNPNDDKDIVFGGAGDDRIITGDDDDLIDGGSGSDWISAGFDDDSVRGQSGDDLIEGGEGNDVIEGGIGNDVIYGGLEDPLADLVSFPDDEPDANGFQDLVPENNGDLIYGGDGNDTIYGQDDDDTLFGDAGNDFLSGDVDDDILFGGDGNDTALGGQGVDTIDGGSGEDLIEGGEGADALFGGLNSDRFVGGTAGDVVIGGEDSDDSDVDVLDLTGTDVNRVEYVDGDPEAGTVFFNDGSTMTFAEIENVIPCFTPGTMIATPRGERLVEELQEGDRIITRDNGIQEIAWVGHKKITGQQLVQNPHLTPILIKRGSLGQGLPERDMMVSPNHRMLVASDKTQLYFEETEVLASAKHMVGAKGIHAVDVMATTYIHFMFERHEVVLSNGAWTESFQPGDYSLKGIGNAQRAEIFDLFPELATKTGLEGYQSARKSLKKHETHLLMD